MMKILKQYWFLLLIAGLIVILDQVSKTYVRTAFGGLEGMEMWAPWDWMLPYARIVHVTNTGVAFGMFQGMGFIFAILAMIVSLAIIYYFPQVPEEDWMLRLSLSMMLAGALGNLIDRLFNDGRVIDFISVGNFPVFNVADASISVGVAVLIVGMWVQENKLKKAQKAQAESNEKLESESQPEDQQAG